MLTVGDKFPSFDLDAVKAGPEGLGGPGKSFTKVSSESDAGKWKVVFFWPKDFTFVCPTEIAAFGKLTGEFADRDAQVSASPPTASSSTMTGAAPRRPARPAVPDAGRHQARAVRALGILDRGRACR